MTEMRTYIFMTTITHYYVFHNNCIVTLEKSENIYIFIINKMIGFVTTITVTSITIDNFLFDGYLFENIFIKYLNNNGRFL